MKESFVRSTWTLAGVCAVACATGLTRAPNAYAQAADAQAVAAPAKSAARAATGGKSAESAEDAPRKKLDDLTADEAHEWLSEEEFVARRDAARAEYEDRLRAEKASHAERRKERAEQLYARYRPLLGKPGFLEEMKVHADRMARLKRIGNLVNVELLGEDTRSRVLTLIHTEIDRHVDALDALKTAPR